MLNDIKSFQLEEYVSRLKEKKKLAKLYTDLYVSNLIIY